MERIAVSKNFYLGIVLFLICWFSAFTLSAQNTSGPALERSVTVKFSNQRTDLVLNEISKLGGFSFSYNTSVINPEKIISGNYINTPVREILIKIFGNTITFREKKGYIILQKAKPVVPLPAAPPENFVLSGYIREESGVAVTWASVYDKASLESTVSNDYGYYRIRFSSRQLPLTLFFSKQGYRDTSVFLKESSPAYLNIILQKIPVIESTAVNYDSLSLVAENSVTAFFNEINEGNNISDTLYRDYQVSILPEIGTNMKLSGNVINDFSFNVLGGLSMGTRKLEIGGLFNLDKHDVQYVQIGGFSNLVGGSVKGVQIGGFTNVVRDEISGVQVGGFVNASFNDFKGLQIAGFVNSVKGGVKGMQLAGFVNTALDSVNGFQLAGFCNVAGNSLHGMQLAGFCNVVPDTLQGTQLGFINYTRNLKGTQLGFFNYSQTTESIPVGFMSFVNDGYHKIEISADEILPVNIAFRSGVNAFHNILTAGLQPFTGDSLLWNFGYGIGTSTHLHKKILLEFDITSSQMVENAKLDKINLVNKAYLGFDVSIAPGFSLAFGATLNGQLTNLSYNKYPDIFTYYEPKIIHTETWTEEDLQLKMWIGGKVALRFL